MLGCSPYLQPRKPCRNLCEVVRNPEATLALINKEVAMGHMLVPFDEQLFEDMVFSPINIVLKAGTKKYRLIHDLAYPYNCESVNSCIPEENSSVQYHHIDEVINMALAIGMCMRRACCNIETAFHHQSMHRSQLFSIRFHVSGKILY